MFWYCHLRCGIFNSSRSICSFECISFIKLFIDFIVMVFSHMIVPGRCLCL